MQALFAKCNNDILQVKFLVEKLFFKPEHSKRLFYDCDQFETQP